MPFLMIVEFIKNNSALVFRFFVILVIVGCVLYGRYWHEVQVTNFRNEVAQKAVKDYAAKITTENVAKQKEDEKVVVKTQVIYKDRVKYVTKKVQDIKQEPTNNSEEMNKKYDEVLKCFKDC